MSTGNYLHVNLVDKARRLCGTEVHTQPQGDPKGGPSKGSGKGSPRPGSQSNKSDTETTKKADVDKSNDAPYCRGCGRKHPAECELGPKGVNHPDWNDTKKSWSQSKIGLRWKEHKKYSLPWNKSLNDPSWTNPKPLKSAKRDADKPDDNPTKKRKCKSHTIMTTQHIKNEHSYLLTCSLSTTFSEIPDEFECLLDTGALDTNYVSRAVGDLIIKKGGTRKPCSVEKICSCSSKVCVPCLGVVHFDLTFFNDLTKKREKICLTATIIEMDFDIILGRRDIYKHKILFKTYNQMFADLIDQSQNEESLMIPPLNATRLLTVTCPRKLASRRIAGDDAHISLSECIRLKSRLPSEIHYLNVSRTKAEVIKKEQLLTGSSGCSGDEDLYDDDEDWDPFNKTNKTATCTITGSAYVQTEVRKLVEEYKDIFSTTLTDQPALIPPMQLKVDEERWKVRRNATPHRAVSTVKQKEIKRQIDEMLEAKLIRPSQATHYSQVLLTPKPNNQWRFCVDYRNLNDCTQTESWPLPNIKETLNRIGSTRSQIYGIMDLTKGFYQAPLHEMAKLFTAFICFCGVFEWLRVPMGLKGAPSYFQRMLATIVFQGLIHIIMELYIDDIIVHAKTDIEFIDRLRKVFERLRKFKVTVNPGKCRFGLDHIEYVGHS
jgi:hypothetical protein